MEIYLDLAVILNFLVDFLLLLGTNRLTGFPLGAGRCSLAAALGGIYSGLCLLGGLRFLGSLPWRLVFLGLMGSLAFGWNKSAIQRTGVFVLLSLALGGMALRFGRGELLPLILGAGGLWGLCRVAFGEQLGGREFLPLELHWGNRQTQVVALRDSGNTLKDPITGEGVLIVDRQTAQTLTGLTPQQLRTPVETLAASPIPGLRLIPYQAVGQSGGMLLALRLPKVKLGNRCRSAVVAFSPEGLGENGGFQALCH